MDVMCVVAPPSVSAVTETNPWAGAGLGVEKRVLWAIPGQWTVASSIMPAVTATSGSKKPPVLYVLKWTGMPS